ncbi:MAG TPA: PAS domain S-box protein [Nitrospiraceae bacterium]|nr:PAS domain S-box protein [Nitrospiraceae bacterium]
MRDDEAPYQLLLEKTPSPIIAFDRDTLDILTVNDAAVHQYGYSRQEFLGMTIADIHPSAEVPGMIERCALPGKDCKLDPVRAGVYQHRKKDGTLMDADIVCYPIPFDGRDGIFLLITDVREKTKQRRIA